MKGEWSAETRSFIFTMEALSADGARRRYRRIEELIDEEHRVATTYLLTGSEVVKVLEGKYERMIPCPSGVRAVFDDLTGGGR